MDGRAPIIGEVSFLFQTQLNKISLELHKLQLLLGFLLTPSRRIGHPTDGSRVLLRCNLFLGPDCPVGRQVPRSAGFEDTGTAAKSLFSPLHSDPLATIQIGRRSPTLQRRTWWQVLVVVVDVIQGAIPT